MSSEQSIIMEETYLDKNTGFNTGWLFYRDYFSGNAHSKNARLENQQLRRIPEMDGNLVNSSFHLKTTYPGLLIGTGYLHESKKEDEAIKIGFYFDHATGMPVIPGSSLKGALRGAFPQFSEEEAGIDFDENRVDELPAGVDKSAVKEALPQKKERALFIHILLFNEEKESLDLTELQAIHAFELETFEGRKNWKGSRDKGDHFNGIYRRDLFFEAVPVAIYKENLAGSKRLFGTDYITPHKNKDGKTELDPFSDPTPLKFLKVMPEVVYEFSFRLQDSKVWENDLANIEKKEALFRQLISLQGLGAKTNVGYGNFVHCKIKKPKPLSQPGFEQIISKKAKEKLRHNTNQEKNNHTAIVADISEEEYLFRLDDDCFLVQPKARVIKKFEVAAEKRKKDGKAAEYKPLEIGDQVMLHIIEPKNPDELNFKVLPIWIQ